MPKVWYNILMLAGMFLAAAADIAMAVGIWYIILM